MSDNSYQLNIFNFDKEHYKITKPIRLIELFAGIGAQAKALEVLGVPFEHYKICEWAYPSIKAYNSIHLKDFTDYSQGKTKEELIDYLQGNISTDYNIPCDVSKKNEQWLRETYNHCIATHNLMNIMKTGGKDLEIVDTDKYCYIMTYSFPCQDLSLAGTRKGMETSQADGGTRSGLLWEVERILDELENKPQILLMENVPEVIGTKNVEHFNKWLAKLESLGYSNFFQTLNAKDYGIPQNRRRCFMISILGEFAYDFPLKIKLKYRLKDFLEKQVDEKYYLSDKMIEFFTYNDQKQKERGNGFSFNPISANDNEKVAKTITTRNGSRMDDNFIAEKGSGQTLKTQMEVGVVVKSKNLKQELCDKLIEEGKVKEMQVIRHSYTTNRLKGDKPIDTVESVGTNVSPTLDTRCDCLGVVVKDEETSNSTFLFSKLRIRKLTPKECVRLMGFEDSDYHAMKDIGLSDAQIYHCAGDSIVTTCLMALLGQMLPISEKELSQKIKEYTSKLV